MVRAAPHAPKESPILDLDLQLKRNELVLVGRAPHQQTMDQAGLYLRDTRFLNMFSLRLNGVRLQVLDCQSTTPDRAVFTRTNPPAADDAATAIAPHSLLVRTDVTLDTGLQATLLVRNYGVVPLVGLLELDVASDFLDMFDVRGMAPTERATPLAPVIEKDAVGLAARSVDGQLISTRVTTSPSAWISALPAERSSGATLGYHLDLAAGEDIGIEVRIGPNPVGPPLTTTSTDGSSDEFTPRVTVRSSSEAFDRFVRQCDADLALLQTSFPDGTLPAAGIPWYVAPFGRDSLIVGLQTMHAYPDRVASTLRVLAALQASEEDPWREAQPGKILHEMRYGDMARTGQVPHTPYFGSIDATPLFVMVFAEHYLWHRDDALFDTLIESVRRALGWIERHGDIDGDGLIEFSGSQRDEAHISRQGWKDSFDSLHFADGREVEGPIALIEVQGYVHAAYRWLGEAVRLRGDDTWADELQTRAEQVREAVETGFWMEEAGYYAQALDGRKRRVDAISSNPGHLLFCGLPSTDRAALVAERMGRPDLDAGWGLRTLATGMVT